MLLPEDKICQHFGFNRWILFRAGTIMSQFDDFVFLLFSLKKSVVNDVTLSACVSSSQQSCHIFFTHVFTALCCIFEVLILV